MASCRKIILIILMGKIGNSWLVKHGEVNEVRGSML